MLYLHQPLSQTSTAFAESEHPSSQFLPQGKSRHPAVHLFKGFPEEVVFVLLHSEWWWNWNNLDAWRCCEQRRMVAQLGMIRRKSRTRDFSFTRETKEAYIQSSYFWEGYPKDWYLNYLTWDADREMTYFGCLVATENKGGWGGLLLGNQTTWSSTQTLEEIRDNELL